MPLDNVLNNDINQSLSLHCAITLELDDNDERKFSMRTPHEIFKRKWRIFQERKVPFSSCILQDINKAVLTFRTVFQHQCRIVPGRANRLDHRYYVAGRNKSD